ncbi:MAG: T9SS type A sorting domain-containing protein [Saprospiraceae bacterium]|nr:T9SS type A sorting domain-containing protein [Saprospiraceae bacterium]
MGVDKNWKELSCKVSHVIALKTDGTIWAWGENVYGQLGDGSTIEKLIPTKVGIQSDWKFISADYGTSYAIKNNNTLWVWVSNLGNGSSVGIYKPIQVTSIVNWKTITSFLNSAAALRNDGTLWSWGSNELGQLGDGTTEWRFSQVQVNCPVTDANDFESDTSSDIFPNPAKDILYINTANSFKEIKVFSINGIHHDVRIVKVNDQLMQLDVQNLLSGMYFITIGNETRRWVKL